MRLSQSRITVTTSRTALLYSEVNIWECSQNFFRRRFWGLYFFATDFSSTVKDYRHPTTQDFPLIRIGVIGNEIPYGKIMPLWKLLQFHLPPSGRQQVYQFDLKLVQDIEKDKRSKRERLPLIYRKLRAIIYLFEMHVKEPFGRRKNPHKNDYSYNDSWIDLWKLYVFIFVIHEVLLRGGRVLNMAKLLL